MKTLTIQLKEDIYTDLQNLAVSHGIPMTQVLRQLIREAAHGQPTPMLPANKKKA